MSILKAILAEKPVREGLKFGIQENVRLVAISNEKRMKDGEVIKRNSYLTFAQYDSEGKKKLRQSTFSYFDLDPTKAEMLMDNLSTQVSQLMNIANVLKPETTGNLNLVSHSKATTQEELLAELSDNKKCLDFINGIYKNFETAVVDVVNDKSALLRLKVVTDKNNRSTQLPKDGIIVEPMTQEHTNLKLSAYEVALSQKVPTAAIAADNVSSEGGVSSGLISL